MTFLIDLDNRKFLIYSYTLRNQLNLEPLTVVWFVALQHRLPILSLEHPSNAESTNLLIISVCFRGKCKENGKMCRFSRTRVLCKPLSGVKLL